MRVFARRERPHPGAKLSLFENEDGWRYTLWVTSLPSKTKAWRGKTAASMPRTGSTLASKTPSGLGRTPASAGSPATTSTSARRG
jgi:hypothetical protein